MSRRAGGAGVVRLAVVVLSFVVAACTGQIVPAGKTGSGTSGNPPGGPHAPGEPSAPLPPPGAKLCTPGAVPEATLTRMSGATYTNALEDIFGKAAVDAIRPTLGALASKRTGTYSTELAPPTYAEIESYVEVASALGFELTKDAKSLGVLRPCLAMLGAGVDPTKDQCLGQFATDLGRRILRRPLTAEEKQTFLESYSIGGQNSAGDGVATLLTAMLVDPGFLYFVELSGKEQTPGVVQLTAHETAARVARVLWDSVPDAELLAAADAGLSTTVLDKQIERMWKSPRARPAMRRFFQEWLDMEKLPFPSKTFAPDAAAQTALRDALAGELLGFTERLLFDRDGTFADLMLDRSAGLADARLAKVYGVAASAAPITLADNRRAGLLTRAGWLATVEVPRSNAGHVIKRGVKLAHFMCRELPPPDPALFPPNDPANPTSGPALNIRQRFARATAQEPCHTCHAMIDGLGAPFGRYGSAGEWLDAELIVDDKGNSSNASIDPRSTLSIDGKDATVADALELSQVLAGSSAGPECLARQLVQNMLGRKLQQSDGCLVQAGLDGLADRLQGAGSVRAAFARILTAPEFATGRLHP